MVDFHLGTCLPLMMSTTSEIDGFGCLGLKLVDMVKFEERMAFGSLA